jgi:hypothetical protein
MTKTAGHVLMIGSEAQPSEPTAARSDSTRCQLECGSHLLSRSCWSSASRSDVIAKSPRPTAPAPHCASSSRGCQWNMCGSFLGHRQRSSIDLNELRSATGDVDTEWSWDSEASGVRLHLYFRESRLVEAGSYMIMIARSRPLLSPSPFDSRRSQRTGEHACPSSGSAFVSGHGLHWLSKWVRGQIVDGNSWKDKS